MIRLSGILIAFVLCNLRDSNDTHSLFLIQARVYFSSVIRDVEVMEYEFQSCRVTLATACFITFLKPLWRFAFLLHYDSL